MVLYHLLIAFTLLYRASYQLSCDDCPMDSNIFNELITDKNVPAQLNNCTFNTNALICSVDIKWYRNPAKTKISLIAGNDRKAPTPDDVLYTDIGWGNEDNKQQWIRYISYSCSSDKCNSLIELKRLLESLTFTDTFEELEYLLKPTEPFQGSWCELYTNGTASECDININSTDCKQCTVNWIDTPGINKVCASCLTDPPDSNMISRAVNLHMIDRTRDEDCTIRCQSPNCSSVSIKNIIRQKSTVEFDFARFLDGKSGGVSIIPTSFSKMLLTFLVLIVKAFH